MQASFQAIRQSMASPPLTPDGLRNEQVKAPTDQARAESILASLWSDTTGGRLAHSESKCFVL